MALRAGSPARVGTRSNTETANDCVVVCTALVLRVRLRLWGTAIFLPGLVAAHAVSNLWVTAIAPLLTFRCECALRSLEVAELFLLLGAQNFVNLGLHAGVRYDQPCQQTCFSIGESFDLLCI